MSLVVYIMGWHIMAIFWRPTLFTTKPRKACLVCQHSKFKWNFPRNVWLQSNKRITAKNLSLAMSLSNILRRRSKNIKRKGVTILLWRKFRTGAVILAIFAQLFMDKYSMLTIPMHFHFSVTFSMLCAYIRAILLACMNFAAFIALFNLSQSKITWHFLKT